jgi:hypothetical protein
MIPQSVAPKTTSCSGLPVSGRGGRWRLQWAARFHLLPDDLRVTSPSRLKADGRGEPEACRGRGAEPELRSFHWQLEARIVAEDLSHGAGVIIEPESLPVARHRDCL